MTTESFRWDQTLYDVSAMLRDIASGHLRPREIDLEEAFIRAYASTYLDNASQHARPPIQVSAAHARSVSGDRLATPVILVHVGDGNGLVSLNEERPEPHYVIADGNHRIVAAAEKGRRLRAYILTPEQSRAYASSIA